MLKVIQLKSKQFRTSKKHKEKMLKIQSNKFVRFIGVLIEELIFSYWLTPYLEFSIFGRYIRVMSSLLCVLIFTLQHFQYFNHLYNLLKVFSLGLIINLTSNWLHFSLGVLIHYSWNTYILNEAFHYQEQKLDYLLLQGYNWKELKHYDLPFPVYRSSIPLYSEYSEERKQRKELYYIAEINKEY